MLHSQTLLAARVFQLEASNKAASERKLGHKEADSGVLRLIKARGREFGSPIGRSGAGRRRNA